jgi:hypothetical protein
MKRLESDMTVNPYRDRYCAVLVYTPWAASHAHNSKQMVEVNLEPIVSWRKYEWFMTYIDVV